MFIVRAIRTLVGFFSTSSTAVQPNTQRIPPRVRNDVWEYYFGNRERGICYACNIPVQRYRAGFHCAHVVPRCKGGPNTVENLRVCCPGCNTEMGSQNLYTYIYQKELKGPGSKNIQKYFNVNPEAKSDTRIIIHPSTKKRSAKKSSNKRSTNSSNKQPAKRSRK